MKKSILAFSILLVVFALNAFPGGVSTIERVDKQDNVYELSQYHPNDYMYLTKYDKTKKKLCGLEVWNEGEGKNGFYVQLNANGAIVAKELYSCSFKNEFESFELDQKEAGVAICLHRVEAK